MKLVMCSFLLILTSCFSDPVLTVKDVETITVKCSPNEGLEEVVASGEDYTAFCSNGAHYSSGDFVSRKNRETLTKEELANCLNTCAQNEGLESIKMTSYCSKDDGAFRFARCLERTNINTCTCKNKVSKSSSNVRKFTL